jgi:hypothetical protein
MEFRPNFGALETAQQSKGIPEDDPPGQSGTWSLPPANLSVFSLPKSSDTLKVVRNE